MTDHAETLFETSPAYLGAALRAKQQLQAEFEAANTRVNVKLVIQNSDLDALVELHAMSDEGRRDPKKVAAFAREAVSAWVASEREARRPVEEKIVERLPPETQVVPVTLDVTIYALGLLLKNSYLDVEQIADPVAIGLAIFAALQDRFSPKAPAPKYQAPPSPPISANLKEYHGFRR